MTDDLSKEIADLHARAQEYAIHDDEARAMTPDQFAAKHQATLKPYFPGSLFVVVQLGRVDYYWSRRDGTYDGWGMKL